MQSEVIRAITAEDSPCCANLQHRPLRPAAVAAAPAVRVDVLGHELDLAVDESSVTSAAPPSTLQ